MELGVARGTSHDLTIRTTVVSASWSGLVLAFAFASSFSSALPFQEDALFLTDLDVVVRAALAAK
eukprot:6909230-Prorocentrum_lima.AAC.1